MPLPTGFIDGCTEEDSRFDENVDTSIGDPAFGCLYLSLVQASGGMDAHMAILLLKALYSGLNLKLHHYP
jgi:hypothetical protein